VIETTPVTLAQGDGSRIADARRTVVRTEEEWRALWAAHAAPGTAPPAVDFGSRMVAAVFAGERPSAGFAIAIVGAKRNGALTLLVEERRVAPGVLAAQLIVTPFHIVTLPRDDGRVIFADADATRVPSEPAAGPARVTEFGPRSASSTGLTPSLAAALAYLAGPFSGLVILLAEHTSGFVRFHAWQSVIGLGALALLAVGFLFLAFAGLLVSPGAFMVFYWMSALTAATWVVAWAICLVKAFGGEMWKLPWVGDRAENRVRSASPASATEAGS
jgi:uncharacterized membrane protein